MKRRGFHLVVAVLAVCLLASTHAFAQGGGASTTGSINGKVADSSGGVLPGRHRERDQPVGDGRPDARSPTPAATTGSRRCLPAPTR